MRMPTVAGSKRAAINTKFVIWFFVTLVIAGVAAVGGRFFIKHSRAQAGLRDGRAAAAAKDWAKAYEGFREYLRQSPDDVPVLREYVAALAAVRPQELVHIRMAIEGYRRISRADPDDLESYRELMRLYHATRNYSDLLFVAEKKKAQLPEAQLYAARAEFGLRKFDVATDSVNAVLKTLAETQTVNDTLHEAYILSTRIKQEEKGVDFATLCEPLLKAITAEPEAVQPQLYLARIEREAAFRMIGKEPDKNLLASAHQRLMKLHPQDPLQQTLVAVELLEHGEADRAEQLLIEAEKAPEHVGPSLFLVSQDWELARFVLKCKIALSRGKLPEGTQFVQESLNRLTDRAYRFMAEPEAIRVYLMGRQVALDKDDRALADKELAAAQEVLGRFKETDSASERKLPRATIAVLEALVAQGKGDYYGVIALLEPVLESKEPEVADAWGLLAEAYGKVGHLRRAAAAAEQYGMMTGRESRDLQIQQLNWYIEQRDWARAATLVSKWTEVPEGDAERQVLIGKVKVREALTGDLAQRESKLAEVDAILQRIRARHPKSASTAELAADLAAARNQPEEAERVLIEATTASESADRARRALGDFYEESGRPADALRMYQELASKSPSDPDVWLRLGDLYAKQRDYDNAAMAFVEGEKNAPSEVARRSFQLKQAVLEFSRGNPTAGDAKMRALAEADPGDGTIRRVWLSQLDLRSDAQAEKAQALISELKAIEGARGLEWKVWQADLLLANRTSDANRRSAIELLRSVKEADPEWDRPLLLLGEAYEMSQDWRAAENLYLEAIEKNPNSLALGQRLARYYQRRGREDEYRKLLKSHYFPETVQVAQATAEALDRGDLETAIRILEKYCQEKPDDVEGQVMLTQLRYRKTSNADAALKALEALAARSDDPNILRTRVAILQATGKVEAAQTLLADAVAKKDDFATRELRATFHQTIGDLATADGDFRKLPELDRTGEGEQRLGVFLVDTKKLDEAIDLWETASRRYPKNSGLQRSLAKARMLRNQGNDRNEAIKIVDSLSRSADTTQDAELKKLKGLALLDQGGSRAEGRALLEEAVSLNPMLADAHLALIELSLQESDIQNAQKLAQAAIAALPQDARLHGALARVAHRAGNRADALQSLRAALDLDPAEIQSLRLLAQAMTKEDEAEWMKRIDSAIQKNPREQEFHVLKARALAQLGREADGVRGLEQFVENNPNLAGITIFLTLADFADRRGDGSGVDAWILRAIEAEPNNDVVRRAKITWLARQNKFGDIVAMADGEAANAFSPLVIAAAAMELSRSPDENHRKLAIGLVDRTSKRIASDDPFQLDFGSFLYQAGLADRALEVYAAYRKSKPDDTRALNDQAWIVGMAKNELKKALELADRGIVLAPRDANLRDTRGQLLLNSGQYDAAMVDFQQVVQIATDPGIKARAYMQLARCQSKQGDKHATRESVDAALKIDSESKALTDEERKELAQLRPSDPQ